MAWYTRFRSDSNIEEETLPVRGGEYPIEVVPEAEDNRQNWLMLALLALAALALAIMIVFVARWAVNRTNSGNSTNQSQSTTGLPKPPPVDLKPGN
jgi:hypothetical protein